MRVVSSRRITEDRSTRTILDVIREATSEPLFTRRLTVRT